ncbi:MAG: hypothetical protein VKJ64_10555 [Leptolyngbyaceae bacterium]|nr:hypothetical protein [Leptolyngbyaceae bacterium]
MSSIILSFVGNQDPFSDNTEQEGSIVTLVKHLLAQNFTIKHVFLLHTTDMIDRAELTQGWLGDAPLQLPQEAIALLPVDPALSADPVNVPLATQAAQLGLAEAMACRSEEDWIEFNASSGTPVMKSTWSILQAAGYAPQSRIWQVRNPKEMGPNQARVFQANVDGLRRQFDVAVAKRQINDYNYTGALASLTAAGIVGNGDRLTALLLYGHCRLAFDFNRAHQALSQVMTIALPPSEDADEAITTWQQQLGALRQRQDRALVMELYHNARIKLKNQEYADFLVRLSSFQEKLWAILGQQKLGFPFPAKYADIDGFWLDVCQIDGGKLGKALAQAKFKGTPLKLEGFVNRPKAIAILEYFPDPKEIVPLLKNLSDIYDQRNRNVHGLEGVSSLPDGDRILTTMRTLLKRAIASPPVCPFDSLNQEILERLEVNL